LHLYIYLSQENLDIRTKKNPGQARGLDHESLFGLHIVRLVDIIQRCAVVIGLMFRKTICFTRYWVA